MAITVTDRGTVTKLNGAAVSGTFTATANNLIATVVLGFNNVGTTPSVTMSDTIADTGGGAWVTDASDTIAVVQGFVYVFHRILGTSPGTGKTVTATDAVSNPDMLMSTLEIAGYNTTTPVPSGQAVAGHSVISTLTVSLPNPPAATSLVITGCVSQGDTAVAAPSGFGTTETSQQFDGDGYGVFYQNGGGSPPQSAAYTSLATVGHNYAVILEIQGAGKSPPFRGRRSALRSLLVR